MKTLSLFVFLLVSSISLQAQNTFRASDIVQLLDRGQSVDISNATIQGDLDFTTIKKKYKGGRYGIRGGIAQEYFTRVEVPMSFSNCVFEGEIITKKEVWDKRTRKENFTTFNAEMTFSECTFLQRATFESVRIKEVIAFENNAFEKSLRFEHVHFEKAPIFVQNMVKGKFENKHTNWNKDKSDIAKPTPKPTNLVQVTFKNPTLKKVNIKFGNEKWTLSPLGKSQLERKVGTEVYLISDDQKKRLVLTLNKAVDGETFDVSKF